jgi:hypothetical protein
MSAKTRRSRKPAATARESAPAPYGVRAALILTILIVVAFVWMGMAFVGSTPARSLRLTAAAETALAPTPLEAHAPTPHGPAPAPSSPVLHDSVHVYVHTGGYLASMNCRTGPGAGFPVLATIVGPAVVRSRNADSTWFLIENPSAKLLCWVARTSLVEVVGDTSTLPLAP